MKRGDGIERRRLFRLRSNDEGIKVERRKRRWCWKETIVHRAGAITAAHSG